MKRTKSILLALVFAFLSTVLFSAEPVEEKKSITDFTVFAFSQSGPAELDPQVFDLAPDINIRGTQKWFIWGDDPADYDPAVFNEYFKNNTALMGGGTVSIIFEEEFDSRQEFLDLITRDADNQPVPHSNIQAGAHRGSLANPEFREYLMEMAKIQIDIVFSGSEPENNKKVFGVFLDEVNGCYSGGITKSWNGNEGFDDWHCADFNRFLINKYPAYTEKDWKEKFGMTDENIITAGVAPDDLENNFNYRTYLQENGFNGATGYNDSPHNHANPLSAEWGRPVGNRLYSDSQTFMGTYQGIYFEEIVTNLRTYARVNYDQEILITSNGIWPLVDFNCLGMYDWNPDDPTRMTGADYVPVTDDKRLNGAKSLMSIYKKMYNINKQIADDVPLVTFIDWPTDMMANYCSLPTEDQKDFWRIFGAETYAAGIFPAFHLKTSIDWIPTATDLGLMDFFKEYTPFYKWHRGLYLDISYSDRPVVVKTPNISSNLMVKENPWRDEYRLHLVNHNYEKGIIPQKEITIEIDFPMCPYWIDMVSPDFNYHKSVPFKYNNGKLTITVDKIDYYNVIVIK